MGSIIARPDETPEEFIARVMATAKPPDAEGLDYLWRLVRPARRQFEDLSQRRAS
jgi:hypothetical protein